MGWDRLKLITPPTEPVIPLTLAKAQCRVDFDDDDALITQYIAAAQGDIDGPRGAGVALLTQTWQLTLDNWPLEIKLPLGPFQSIVSVTYTALDGSTQVLDPSQYIVDSGSDPVTITRAFGIAWPSVRLQKAAVQVAYICGYGATPASVPTDLVQAMLLLISHYYQNRDAVVGVDNRDSSTIMPGGVDRILDRYRSGVVA